MPGIRKIKHFSEMLLTSTVTPSREYLWTGAHVVVRKTEQGTRSHSEGRPEFLIIESVYADAISDVFWHVRNLAQKKQMYDHGSKFYFFELLAKCAVEVADRTTEPPQMEKRIIERFCTVLCAAGNYE